MERVGGTLVQTSLALLRLPLPERSPPTAASVILTALSVLPQGTARSDRLQFLNEADNVCDYNLKVAIAKQTFFNLVIMFFLGCISPCPGSGRHKRVIARTKNLATTPRGSVGKLNPEGTNK